MADVSEAEFISRYGNLLVQCWDSPAVKKRFMENPVKVLKEFGLDPEGAKIHIKKPVSNVSSKAATRENQVHALLADWNEGKKSGSIDFYFPEEPPQGVLNYELSEAELAAVAGGQASQACCCCCCTGPGRCCCCAP